MKNILFFRTISSLFFLFGILCTSSWAQTFDEVTRRTVPPSPESQIAARLAESSVSNYSGAASVNIPIFDLTGRRLSLPISLSYQSNGIKVNDMASRVGLGWNLNAGGVITRAVRGGYEDEHYHIVGVPDDTGDNAGSPVGIPGWLWHDEVGIDAEKETVDDYDKMPDLFSYNFDGYSGQFYFDQNGGIHKVPHNDLIIRPTFVDDGRSNEGGQPQGVLDRLISFEVITPEGQKYTFGQYDLSDNWSHADVSAYLGGGTLDNEYTSSWYLDEIEDQNTGEKITLEYDVLTLVPYPTSYNEVDYGRFSSFGCSCHAGSPDYRSELTSITIFYQVLKRIETDYYVADFLHEDRNDLPGDKLFDKIRIRNRATNDLIKEFDFSYSYFSNRPTNNISAFNQRLKLLTFKEVDISDAQPDLVHSFSYDETQMPGVNSFEQDVWGYSNNNGATSLLPQLWYYPGIGNGNSILPFDLAGGPSDVIAGADRRPNGPHTPGNILTEITFPTTGKVQFEYEPNAFRFEGEEITGGGVRVSKKKYLDRNNQLLKEYNYDYVETDGLTSGAVVNFPKLATLCVDIPTGVTDIDTYLTRYGSSRQEQLTTKGACVGYSRVEEFQSGNGKTVYLFNNPANTPNVAKTFIRSNDWGPSCDFIGQHDGFPFTPDVCTDYKRGLMTRMEVWKEDGTLISSTDNNYSYRNVSQIPISIETPFNKDAILFGRGVSNLSIQAEFVQLDRTEEMLDGLTTIREFEYHANLAHTNLVASSLTDSDGRIYIDKTSYAHELSAEGDALATQMIQDNLYLLSVPLRVDNYVKANATAAETFVGGIRTQLFERFGMVLPNKFYRKNNDLSEDVVAEILTYDVQARPTSFRRFDFNLETYAYNSVGLLERYQNGTHITDYRYHSNTRLPKVIISPDQTRSFFQYDGFNRLTASHNHYQGQGADDAVGSYNVHNDYSYEYGTENKITSTTTFADGTPEQQQLQEFDDIGRLVKEVLNGVVQNELRYDNLGRIEQQTYLPGNFLTNVYEASPMNRLVQTIFPNGAFRQQAYGKEGEYAKSTATDEDGNVTVTLTDKLGRMYKLRDALNNETLYEYDDRKNVYRVKPANWQTGGLYEYLYDARNRLQSKQIPAMTAPYTYTYKSNDLPETTTDPNGTVLFNVYDNFGRMTEMRFNAANGPLLIKNNYDENVATQPVNQGKLTSTSVWTLDVNGQPDDEMTSSYAYDIYGREEIISRQNHLGGQDVYTNDYNDANWMMAVVRNHSSSFLPQALDIAERYEYDRFGRATRFTHQLDNGPVVTLAESRYNDRDQLVQKDMGDGLQSVDFQYNNRGWLTHINQPLHLLDKTGPTIGNCTPPRLPGELIDLDAETYQGATAADLAELLFLRFQAGLTIGTYDPCGGSGVCDVPDCGGTTPSVDALLSQMNLKYFISRSVIGCPGLFEEALVSGSSSQTGNMLYIIRLCNGEEVYIFSADYDPNLIQGGHLIVGSVNLSATDNTVIFADGSQRLVDLEELIWMVVSGENFRMPGHPDCELCTPDLPGTCGGVSDADVENALAAIEAAASSYTPATVEGRTLLRVVLCNGQEVYLFQEELDQIPGGGTVVDQIPLSGTQTYELGNTITALDRKDLFYLQLYYDNHPQNLSAQAQQNGNISALRWQVAGRDMQAYGFQYDALNRLTKASYSEIAVDNNQRLQYADDDAFSVPAIQYDAVGNILRLDRYGLSKGTDCWSPQMIDQLTYTYNGNRLQSVADQAAAPYQEQGFDPHGRTGQYQYDNNGNMTNDPYKNLQIDYNFLNLPLRIVDPSNGSRYIEFGYRADGQKITKMVSEQGNNYDHDYVEGIEYRNGQLEAIYHQEGRALPAEGGAFRYEFSLKDHLGNSRICFSDLNDDGEIDRETEMLQETHYYPFGMAMEGPWSGFVGVENRYQYNGKELNEDLGLGWMDYGARWYDPAIGRWNAVDPLAEKYHSFAAFGYVANNPIRLIDPDGMQIEYADMPKKDRRAIKRHIRKLKRRSRTFRKAWKDLKKSKHTHTIHSAAPDDMHVETRNGAISAEGNSSDIYLNPKENNIGIPQEAAIAHEIGHAWRLDQGLDPISEGRKEEDPVTVIGMVSAMKRSQYREFEATHFENVVRSELGLPLREEYGKVNDNHTGNTMVLGGIKFLAFRKNRKIIIGKDKSYDYGGKNHYERLKNRNGANKSFNFTKYTDAGKYN